MKGFVALRHAKNPEYEVLFCIPNAPFVDKIFRPAFHGEGLIFQMEVEDVDAEYSRLRALPVTITLALIKSSVTGHHFTISDLSGILIDIVQFK